MHLQTGSRYTIFFCHFSFNVNINDRHKYEVISRNSANSLLLLYDYTTWQVLWVKRTKQMSWIMTKKINFLWHHPNILNKKLRARPDPTGRTFCCCTFWTELICIVTSCCWHSSPLPPCLSSLSLPLPSFLPLPLPSLLADAPYCLAPGPSVRESNSHPVIIRFSGVPTVSASLSVSLSLSGLPASLCLFYILSLIACLSFTLSTSVCLNSVLGHWIFLSLFLSVHFLQ